VAVMVEGGGDDEISGNAIAGPVARAVIEAALR
jgi:hypothetical protein